MNRAKRLFILLLGFLIIGGGGLVLWANMGFAVEGNPPVGFWKLDEGTGTVTKDSSINGNNGNITGALWQPSEQCVLGNCMWFDGVNDVSTVPSSSSLTITGALTISTWIKMQSTSVAERAVISKYSSTGNERGYALSLTDTDKVAFFVDADGTDANQDSINSKTSLALNTWYHVVAVYEPSSKLSIYINGKLDNYGPTDIASINDSTADFKLAGSVSGFTNLFKGYLDEVKVYNYARSSEEIAADYADSSAEIGAGVVFGQNVQDSLNQGLVGYWKMDQTSGNAIDSSGNGLTLTNNNSVTFSGGKYFNAGDFEESSSQSFTIADNALLSTGDVDFSMSAWVNFESDPGDDMAIFAKRNNNTNREFVLTWHDSSGRFNFEVFDSSGTMIGRVRANNVTVTTNTWYFVMAWHDSVNDRIYLQINNGAVDSAQTTGTIGDTTATFRIGASSASAAFMDGKIDEARFYKRVLSAEERSQLYNFGPGPVGYWPMEEGSGTVVSDVSTNGFAGALTGASWTDGKYGKGTFYPETDSYMTVTDNDVLDLGTTNFTLEAFVKTTDTSGGYIMFKRGGTGDDLGYTMYMNSDGTVRLEIGDDTNLVSVTPGTRAINDGSWHHVAMYVDRQNGVGKIYIDGTQDGGDVPISNVTGTLANSVNLVLGIDPDTLNDDFVGTLDEVRIYGYARTTQEIVSDMNALHPTGGSPVGSQLGYWKMDEGYGTTTFDSTINANNGTMSNFSSPASATSGWTQNGKFNKALNFDGSNDLVNFGSASELDNIATFSATAWVNPRAAGESNSGRIIQKAGTAGVDSGGWSFYIDNSNNLNFAVDYSTNSLLCTSPGGAVPFNSWSYVAFTWDGMPNCQGLKFYVNGKQYISGNDTATGTRVSDASYSLIVGNDATGTRSFDGLIDEVKLFGFTLDENSILIDYNRGQSTSLGVLGTSIANGNTASNSAATAYCVPGSTETCLPPVAEWLFEEGQGSSANDSSGNANTGTLTNGANWGIGKIGKGVTLNQATNDYVSVANAASLNITGDLTVETWVNPSLVDTAQRLVLEKGDGATASNRQYSIRMNATPVWTVTVYDGGNTRNAVSTVTPAVGRWDHVALVKKGTMLFIYVNGVQSGSASAPNATNTSSNILAIGRPGATSSNYFKGTVDQTRIFNYARSAAQISYSYNKGLALLHQKFDECQGSTTYDSSGNGFSGTITGTVGTCTDNADTMRYNGRVGKYNYSLDFNGTSNYITVGDHPALQPILGNGFSISAWAKSDDWESAGPDIIVAKWDTNVNGAYYLGVFQDKARGLINGSFSGGVTKSTNSITNLVNGQWAHLVMTWSGVATDPILLYVNGVLDYTISSNQTFDAIADISEPVLIGARKSSAPENLFDGQIDDVRMFSYGLTEYQVKTLYNQGSATRFGPVTGTPAP